MTGHIMATTIPVVSSIRLSNGKKVICTLFLKDMSKPDKTGIYLYLNDNEHRDKWIGQIVYKDGEIIEHKELNARFLREIIFKDVEFIKRSN